MPKFSFGPFLLDGEARTLLRDGKPVAITGKIFDTLLLLVQCRGTLVQKDALLAVVWRGVAVEEANLTNSIYSVRRLLGDSPRHTRFIATISGRGYQFVADVTEITGTSDAALSANRDQIQTRSPMQSNVRKRAIWRGVTAATLGMIGALALVSGYHEPFRTPALTPPVQLTNDGLPKNELVTDGTRVFYASAAQGSPSGWQLLEVPATGGPSRSVPLGNHDMSPIAVSSDRCQLMIEPSSVRQSNDGWKFPAWLWVQPLDRGRAVGLKLQAHDGSWSPDGRQIAYARAEQIGLAGRDGTPIRILADLPGVASGLRWSPQGDRIRFTLHSGVALKDSGIWEVSPVSGQARPLFPGSTSRQADGEWTRDGKYYLFSRAEKGASQIWALPESRTWLGKSTQRPPVPLTTGPMETLLPTPSPDGNRIFFYGIVQRSRLFKRDTRSGRFEQFLPGISGTHVDFSRDGQWMTYSSHPEHTLWRAGADGSKRLRLSPPGWQAMLPVISPDGHEIAFVGGPPGVPGSVFVVDREGGAPNQIVSTQPQGIIEPAWSPNGNSLVLGTSATGQEHTVLYRFDFGDGSLTVMPGSEGLWSPRWSPDGRFVAALHNPDCKLVLYELKSHRQTPLTDFGVAYPAWSHRGQYLYFRAGETREAWFRIGIVDRMIERVVDLREVGTLPAKPSRGIPSWVNSWAGLAPDDSLLTASEVGSIEIYSTELVEH